MLLYYNLTAAVTVGSVKFTHIHSVEIEQSLKELSGRAVIVIPREYYFKDQSVLEFIKAGDPVSIKLGYDGDNLEEFTGYVREVNAERPIHIICDDEMYLLKQGNHVKSWESVTLKQLLNAIIEGFKIDCPDVNLGKFQIDNASPFIVLQELKNQYGFHSYIKGDMLFVGFVGDVKDRVPETHAYEFQRNVRSSKLKYVREEDTSLRIVAISNQPDGTKLKAEVGSMEPYATIRTLNFGKKTREDLRKVALETLEKLRYEGYQGDISGFGVPRTKPGDALRVIDELEPDREGTYVIEAVKIRFNNAVFERINTLSYKL